MLASLITPAEWEALRLSLKVSLWGITLSVPFAIGIAVVLARREFWGKSLLNGIVHLPLVLPPVVIGYLLLVLLGRRGAVGHLLYEWFGMTLAFRWTGAALASAIMGFPLLVRALRLSIEAVDIRLEQAAATLGAPAWWIFLSVTLPLSIPGLLAGYLLSFGRSLGEFGATITFVSNIPGETQTLPLAIYTYTQVPGGDDAAMRLVAISVALSLAALIASEMLARRVTRRLTGI